MPFIFIDFYIHVIIIWCWIWWTIISISWKHVWGLSAIDAGLRTSTPGRGIGVLVRLPGFVRNAGSSLGSSTINTGRCGTKMVWVFFVDLQMGRSTLLPSDFWCLFGCLTCLSFTDPTVIVLLSEHEIEWSYHLAQRYTLINCRKDCQPTHSAT